VRFALDALGRWTQERSFVVERERVRAYAAATNETRPEHVGGDLAPPVFAILPVWDVLHEASESIAPEEARRFIVHGEQDMFLHVPLVPGMELTARAAPVGVHPKPSGTTLVVKTETRDAGGTLVDEQYVTEFFRGVVAEEGGGEAAPDHRVPEEVTGGEPAAAITYAFDDDQTYRYADASGDRFPIHLDEEFARAAGLPGIIVHGLCTMAFTSRAVLEAAGCGAGALRRLAVRFSRPVPPGESLTTRIWNVAPGTYAFEAVDGAGQVVIKDGLAEVSS